MGRVLRYVTLCGTPVVGRVLYFLFSGYDDAFHDHWLSRRLWDPWQAAPSGRDLDMLGSPICKHESDV